MKDKMFEERKEEQEKQCAAGTCDAKAAAGQTDKPSDAACPEELSDDEIESAAGGKSILIPN